MMNRIDERFKELRSRRRKAFIVYITAGDPSLGMTRRLVLGLERSGADIIELGIPFSDPLADGPTIQAASQRALKNKTNLNAVFRMVGALRRTTQIPIAFMTYYNPVLKFGLERFISLCARSGVDGVIVPDLPYEEAGPLIGFAKRRRVAVINLVAPTSTPSRIRDIVRNSTGFIYYVSLTGVTGARRTLPAEIGSSVRMIRSMTGKPIAVGFGVSTRGQARAIARLCDGVIVGSAIVKIISDNQNNREKLLSQVYKFARSLAIAIHNVH